MDDIIFACALEWFNNGHNESTTIASIEVVRLNDKYVRLVIQGFKHS